MSLNDDSLYLIFQLLEYQDLCQCAQVCKRWKTLADVNVLWDRLCAELWEDKVTLSRVHALPTSRNSSEGIYSQKE